MTATTATHEDATGLLRQLAGAEATLRPGQGEAIDALVAGRDVLLVQATGYGKSAVYWIATRLRRDRGAGPTLVVSPLLALMRDQVAAAERAGLRAVTVNSTNTDDWEPILARVHDGEVDVLLVSPERLAAPSFQPTLERLLPDLGMLVVDEAHCLSDHGHDFRPDYQRVVRIARRAGDAPLLACTATANGRVTDDVAGQLDDDTLVLRGPLARPSLALRVIRLPDAPSRYGWIDAYLAARPDNAPAGIVYTLTVAGAEQLAAHLAGRGHRVAAYTSRLEAEPRIEVEDALRDNHLDAVVATSALSMGYDKPDLGFVVNLGAPSSPVAYYQQIGRAGRGIDHADVVLLPTPVDERIWEHFDVRGVPSESEMRAVLSALDDGPRSIVELQRHANVSQTRLDLLLKLLAVEDVVEKVGSTWQQTGNPYTYPAARYEQLVALRRREHAAMRALCADEVDGCLMLHLTRHLDDPADTPCGRCAGCGADVAPVAASDEQEAAAATHLQGVDVLLPARRRWPSGLGEVRGNIPRPAQAQPGRALTGADDNGLQEVVERWRAGDEAAHERLLDAAVKALARWDWDRRPTVLASLLDADRHAPLARLRDDLGRVGRLPVVDAVVTSVPDRELNNSVQQARWALGHVELRPGAADVAGEVVLLLMDRRVSGWSATVAAWRLVTEAGAAAVLPFAVASRT